MNKNHPIGFWEGQLLEITTNNRESYTTQIIRQESALLVDRPVNKKNIPMKIENGMPVSIYFHNDMKELHTFNSKIYILPDKKILIERPSIDSIKKAQRRRFFRVEVAAKMHLIPSSTSNSRTVEPLTTSTYDISGGGVSFICPKKVVETGDDIKGIIYLNMRQESHKIQFNGKVVNTLKLEKELYRMSIQFIDIPESVRTVIIRFCMNKQIELRNKIRGVSLN